MDSLEIEPGTLRWDAGEWCLNWFCLTVLCVLSKNGFLSLLKCQLPSYGSLNSWRKFSDTLLQDTNTAVSLRLSWQRIHLMKFKGSYPISVAYIWLLCGFWTWLRNGWFELKKGTFGKISWKANFPWANQGKPFKEIEDSLQRFTIFGYCSLF